MSWYGVRPAYPGFQAAPNPFTGLNDVQREYYRGNPTAAFSRFLADYPVQNVGTAYRGFLEQAMPDLYRDYQGVVAYNPELDFHDYLAQRAPTMQGAYEATNPYRRGVAGAYRTRHIRRR